MKNLFTTVGAMVLVLLSILSSPLSTCLAQGTAFSYQGDLSFGSVAANGSYDMSFTLYTTNFTGVAVAGPMTNAAIAVSNGLFSTTIDFGNIYSGQSNWLEIAVSTNGANAFVTLAPRQPLLPVPYTVTAANLSGAVSLAQLPAGLITNGEHGVNLSGMFSGNGRSLTRLPSYVITNAQSGVTLSDFFSGSGSGLTNLNASQLTFVGKISSGLLPAAVVNNGAKSVALSGAFTGSGLLSGTSPGDGSGLTNMSASQLAGTIALAQLPPAIITNNEANVTLSGAFSGNVITNNQADVTLSGNFSGVFSGDGSGLTNVPGTSYTITSPPALVSGTSLTAQPNTIYDLTSASLVTVSLPTNANVGDLVQIEGSGPGGWQVIGISNSIYTPFWTEVANGPTNGQFTSIASSYDGTHLAVITDGGGIWTSPDAGATWMQTSAPNHEWFAIASSSDNSRLAACDYVGGVWISHDGGATWIQAPLPAIEGQGITSSSDGVRLSACGGPGPIWTSADGGVTWATNNSPNENWWSIASSSDGVCLAAVIADGGIYISTNSGSNWQLASAPSGGWNSVASSSDGSRVAAVMNPGGIWISTNCGLNWKQTSAPGEYWGSIASSADGTRLVAAGGGGIWASIDSGTTWTAQAGSPSASAIASSSDGTRLAAAVSDGGIFVGSGGFTGSAGTSEEFQYAGNGVWQRLAPNTGYILGDDTLSVIPAAVIINNQSGVTLSGTFSGDGSGLIDIPPVSLPANTITNQETGVTLSGTFSGNGSGLAFVPIGTLPANIITNTETGVTLSGTFSGDGSGLTSISSSALPANVITNTETGVVLSGTLTGNGSGLTLPSNVITNTKTGVVLSGTFLGNGSGLTSVPSSVALSASGQTFNGANAFQVVDSYQGLRVTDGSTNSNISIQPLGGGNSGFQAINFNGYYNAGDHVYNTNKSRWRIFVDQRGTNDTFNIDNYYGGVSNNILSIGTNGVIGGSGVLSQSNLGATNYFTATIGNGSANFTTSQNYGYYAKVGNEVYFEDWVVWTSKGSVSSGNLVLPLPPVPVASDQAVFNIGYCSGFTGISSQPVAYASQGNANLSIGVYSGSGISTVPVTACGASGELQISGTYRWQ